MTDEAGTDVSSAMPETVPLWWRGPGGWFHLLVIVAILAWLWSWSVPGTHFMEEGPLPEIGEVGLNRPQFHHVGGPWYTFTARF